MGNSSIDIKNIIKSTVLDNTDPDGYWGDQSFSTEDKVWIPTLDELSPYIKSPRCTATDYAIACGVKLKPSDTLKLTYGSYWLRQSSENNKVAYFGTDGSFSDNNIYTSCFTNSIGIRPTMNIDISSPNTISAIIGNIDSHIHNISLGEYPRSKVDKSKHDILDLAYQSADPYHQSSSAMRKTGKVYIGYYDKKIDDYVYFEEYEYITGDKYVRVKVNPYDKKTSYFDGNNISKGNEYEWFKVEPIDWNILNWKDMPTSINPKGNGSASSMQLLSDQIIIGGIPFHSDIHNNTASYHNMWQNSSIRGFLNGINPNMIKRNVDPLYVAYSCKDWTGDGFIDVAFDTPIKGNIEELLSDKDEDTTMGIQEIGVARRTRIQRLNPDKTDESLRRQMTDTEKIKSWIDAGQSVLLRGPSGIGKTERLKTMYPDLIYLKLTNNMFPEKVVGSINLQTGQNIPPDFAKQALMACATADERKLILENIQNIYDLADTIYDRSKNSEDKIVILLDELLNVKPAVQSLVYTLVLNRIVETGRGLKLPDNVVVVATGNQKKYSSVAEDLAEPLEKRFDHILDMEPKVQEWLTEYAIPYKVHPAVTGYMMYKNSLNIKGNSSKIEYFYEEPEVGEERLDKYGCRGRTNDPRGWVSVSNTLKAFEENLINGKYEGLDVEDLLVTSLSTKLRTEWAQEFYDFYNNSTLTVEEVISHSYSDQDLPNDVNEKFACMACLLSSDKIQVKECRDFIKKYCGAEYLSLYDLYWVGTNESRAEIISTLEEMDKIKYSLKVSNSDTPSLTD